MPVIESVAQRRRIAKRIIAEALGIKIPSVSFGMDLGAKAGQVYTDLQEETGYVVKLEEGRRLVGHLAAQLVGDQRPVSPK